MNVLIIGGTGVISRAVVHVLQRRGSAVTIVNRGQTQTPLPLDVEWLRQDRRDHEAFAQLFSGRYFDAVIDMVCFTEEEAHRTLDLFRDKSEQIMIVSSVAAYRRPYRTIPTKEDAERLWDNPEFPYGFEKALMERYLQGKIHDGAPVTVVRPSLTFGPGARNVGVLRQNANILHRIKAGKPLIMFGDGTTPWSFSFVSDMARAMVALLGRKEAIGQAFHLASQERTQWNDLYLEFGRIAGQEPVLEFLPARLLYQAAPELCMHLFFEKSHPGLFDDAKLKSLVLDFQWETSLRAGLETVVHSWEEDQLSVDGKRDMLEDRLVEIARDMTASAFRAGDNHGGEG